MEPLKNTLKTLLNAELLGTLWELLGTLWERFRNTLEVFGAC